MSSETSNAPPGQPWPSLSHHPARRASYTVSTACLDGNNLGACPGYSNLGAGGKGQHSLGLNARWH